MAGRTVTDAPHTEVARCRVVRRVRGASRCHPPRELTARRWQEGLINKLPFISEIVLEIVSMISRSSIGKVLE